MTGASDGVKRAAIYTRKSTTMGLEQEFNSLDAQREDCTAYIQRQGWTLVETRYDDGGFTGANTDRPAFQRLMADVQAGQIDVVVCYKVDRLSRSLLDFAKVMELLNQSGASFVSVTQNFSTADAMGYFSGFSSRWQAPGTPPANDLVDISTRHASGWR